MRVSDEWSNARTFSGDSSGESTDMRSPPMPPDVCSSMGNVGSCKGVELGEFPSKSSTDMGCCGTFTGSM